MDPSVGLQPLTVPDDHLTQQDLNVLYNRFLRDTSFNLPPAPVFDNLISNIRPLYEKRLANLRDQLTVGFENDRGCLILGFENERGRLTADFQNDRERFTAEFQNERERLTAEFQNERERLTAEFQNERERLTAEFQNERERLTVDFQNERERLTAEFEHERERLTTDVQKEREIWAAQLDAANTLAKQSNELVHQAGNRLNQYLLRAPMTRPQPVTGSRTRAANWEMVTKTPGFLQGVQLPANPVTIERMKVVLAHVPLLVNTYDFGHENEMYPLVLQLLTTAFNQGGNDLASVFDTSRNPYLGGYMPDLSIVLPGAIEADSCTVCVVVDMKLRSEKKHKKLGTFEDFGQIYDYLVAMQDAQNGRRICVALLSDVHRNYVVTLAAEDCGPPVVRYESSSIFAALAYIHDTALQQTSHLPPRLDFSEDLGRMRRRLGNPRHSLVGEFLIPHSTTGTVMAVKRTLTKTRETWFLNKFAEEKTRPDCIPLMVYNLHDIEYGITPVGIPMAPGMLMSALQTRQIIEDVISATVWIHGQRIVHRDIRCENIVLSNGRAVLIDFDASYFLGWSSPTVFRGGYICIPPYLLRVMLHSGMNHPYFPALADDCHAIVLLAHCLLFPNRFADFRSCEVGVKGSAESSTLLRFWDHMEFNQLWGHFQKVAEGGNAAKLKTLTNLFY